MRINLVLKEIGFKMIFFTICLSFLVLPRLAYCLGYGAVIWEDGKRTTLGTTSEARAINNSGQVVGGYGSKPFLWDDGTLTYLDVQSATDINNKGQIVGTDWNGRPYLSENGTITDFGIRGDAWGINDYAQVVGKYPVFLSDDRLFLWENGIMTDIGTLGGYFSYAYAINNLSQVVGFSTPSSGTPWKAFLWENGVMTDLSGDLGGPGTYSIAYDINNLGQVVGRMGSRGFIWDNGSVTDLGTLGGQGTQAYGINNLGQVVGWSYTASGSQHAFLWENGTMTDLGPFGKSGRSIAYDINDEGQIVGFATPEPSTMLLLGSGLVGLMGLRRRFTN